VARLSLPQGAAAARLPLRRELKRFALGAALVVVALLMVEAVARQAGASDSPVAAGTVVLGLGLAVAVGFGIARDSSVGVLVWLVAALFSVPYAGSIPSIDRLAFLALVGGWFISVVTHRRPLRRFGLTEGLMAAYLLVNLGSMLAPHALPADTDLTPMTFILLGAFFPFALFVLARQTMGDRRAVKSFLWFLTWYGLYFTLMAIFQKIGPHALVFPQEILDPSVGINPERARGPLLNSAADGTALVIAFAAAMFLGTERGIRHRRFALLAALLMPVGIFFTQTRAVWLAAGFAVVLGAMFARGFRRWYLAVLGGAVLVIAINWQKFLSADRQQGGVASESEIDSRLNDISTSLWAIDKEPSFGWGIGRFIGVNTEHHQSWGTLDWNLGYGYIGHNTHLSIATELGFLGLGLWAAVIIAIGVVSARAWRLLPREGLLSRGLVFSFWCAGLCWLINSSVIDMRLFAFVNGLVFVWAGIVAGLGDRARDGTLELEEPEPEEPEEPARVGDVGGLRI
jgi:O-antigen ligase